MKTKTIELYDFDELTPEAQKKAIDNLSNINTNFDWWDNTYDDFARLASYLGVSVDLKKTYFTLSYGQGDGSAYTADIDVLKLVESVKNQSWKEYAPKEKFPFPAITPNIERIARLISKGFIDFSADVRPQGRETYVNAFFEWNYNATDVTVKAHTNIENIAMEQFTEFVNSVCRDLNAFLFRQLRDECDYRSGREAIIETIKANEYTFTANGKLENV